MPRRIQFLLQLLLLGFPVGSAMASPFTDINAGLLGANGPGTWGDYDNDGDLDILLIGDRGEESGSAADIFRNDDGAFTRIDVGLWSLASGSGAWGDYDEDGDLDILLCGVINGGGGTINRVYRNDNGSFVDTGDFSFTEDSHATWGDYDNDGDLDVLLTGTMGFPNAVSLVYRNDSGVFTDIGAGLTGVRSTGAWGDYDDDGDLDILLTGYTGSGYASLIYRNDAGVFTDIQAGLQGLGWGSGVWGDFDNDGDLDILATGYSGAGYVSLIYRNDSGTFTDLGADLAAAKTGAWGDYDNDGDLDLLLTGYFPGSTDLPILYRNDNGLFTESEAGLLSLDGTGAWGDYDNDGDLDILLTGRFGCCEDNYLSLVYENGLGSTSNPPVAGLAYLHGNYPNPFNPSTAISFTLPEAMHARLDVYDMAGRHVSTLVDGLVSQGVSSVRWSGQDDGGGRVGSGVYLYRLTAGALVETKRMVLLK